MPKGGTSAAYTAVAEGLSQQSPEEGLEKTRSEGRRGRLLAPSNQLYENAVELEIWEIEKKPKRVRGEKNKHTYLVGGKRNRLTRGKTKKWETRAGLTKSVMGRDRAEGRGEKKTIGGDS